MRHVRIHDTLTGEPRPLEPRDPPKVGIYACGPTVYAPIHVGNARPYVVFALLKRFLEHEGSEVTLVENVTDVNDKIYDAARERGIRSAELARDMTDAYVEATDRLGLGRPDREPKASETIEALIESGHAYQANGDVYFRVGSFDGYGKLSNRPLEEMHQGEGDDAAEMKESPQDFALWKGRKEGEDTWWDAPWGQGRPGWHIECSAMAETILGLDFEVHGGGSDLVFPHHENEIAQTEAARGKPLARVWMHNGMVEMDAEKMAKSVGNIRLLHVALDEFGRDALVMWLVVRWGDDEPGTHRDRWLVLIAYVLALTSTNHLMGVLALPALAVYVLWTDWRTVLRPWAIVTFYALLLAVTGRPVGDLAGPGVSVLSVPPRQRHPDPFRALP